MSSSSGSITCHFVFSPLFLHSQHLDLTAGFWISLWTVTDATQSVKDHIWHPTFPLVFLPVPWGMPYQCCHIMCFCSVKSNKMLFTNKKNKYWNSYWIHLENSLIKIILYDCDFTHLDRVCTRVAKEK